MRPTSTEENYLKAVYKLSRKDKNVGTNDVSQELGTTPASVTDMIRKLSEKGLVQHQPYKGVNLTEKGKKTALEIVRKHRLWEVFLVEKLAFSWDEIHEIAEQLEHIHAPELIKKLDAFLGFPKYDPHGDPIPSETGEVLERRTLVLKNCKPGDKLTIVAVMMDSSEFLQYLDRQGLNIGKKLTVMEKLPFDHSLLLELEEGTITVSTAVSENILVVKSRS